MTARKPYHRPAAAPSSSGVLAEYMNQITVPTFRTVHTQTEHGQSWSSVPNGTKTGTVLLSIDVAKLMRFMGERALRTKSGKSRALDGIVTARAINVTRTEPDDSTTQGIVK